MSKEKTIEDSIKESVFNQTGIDKLNFEQSYVFSDLERVPKKRVVAVSLISIVDEFKVKANKNETNYETCWFTIDKLPKIGYDHSRVIDVAISQLKTKLYQSKTLQQIFPSDFTSDYSLNLSNLLIPLTDNIHIK